MKTKDQKKPATIHSFRARSTRKRVFSISTFPAPLRATLIAFFSLGLCLLKTQAADLSNWPSQYKIAPWETARLTAADVVGPDGIVYPDFTGVGVTGGIPDVNNPTVRATYTVFNVKTGYGAKANGSSNDNNAIANAATAVRNHLNANPANKAILYFPAGTYLLSKPIEFTHSNLVIDGDGPASTVIKLATNTSYSNQSLFHLVKPANLRSSLTVTAFAPRGANTLTFGSDPAAAGHAVGAWVRLHPTVSGVGTTMSDRFSNPDNDVIYTDAFYHTGRITWAKVTAINSAARTVTLDRTLAHDYFVDESPSLRRIDMMENSGIQDLTIETVASTATIDPLRFENAANCWIKNIKTVKARSWPIYTFGVTRFEVRDSQFLGTWININQSGGVAYLGWCDPASDSLMDNVQASDLRHMGIFQLANRCVIRNSTFTGQTIQSPQLHGRFPHENLIEGTTFNNLYYGGASSRGITSFGSDGAYSTVHGVNGPRNVYYNNRVLAGMATAAFNGVSEGFIFAYNRILKNDDNEAKPAVLAMDRTFDFTLRGNIFQAINTLPALTLTESTCTGWDVTDNKFYGSNGHLFEGDSEPALAHNNRFFSSATTPDAATAPEVASIYAWQKANANTARLVLVIPRRTVTDTGGTTQATVVRVKAATTSDLTVTLSADIAGLSFPATVTIPAGAAHADFTLTGVNVSGGEKLVTLTATAPGLLADPERVAVLDQDVAQPNFGVLEWPVPATGLPANWKAANHGIVTSAGSQSFNSGTWSLSGAGIAAETFQASLVRAGRKFVYQTVDGDGEIRARITSATGDNQVGLMIADDESAHTDFIWVQPNGRVLHSSNNSNNGLGNGPVFQAAAAGTKIVPCWLRLKRTGTTFTAYRSTVASPASEADWTVLATVDLYAPTVQAYKSPAILDQRMHYGMFINSGSATTLASATFTNVQLTGTVVPIGGTTVPAAPSGLSATAASSSAIHLAWTDNATDETGYRVERSPDGISGWTTLIILPAGSVTHVHSGLSAGSTHHYRVFATGTGGDSAASATASATTAQLAQSITFDPLAARTFGDASFTLSATASSGLPISYSSSVPGVATVSGNTVSIIGAGSTIITATQSGNASFSAATPVPQTLVVNQAAQALTFAALPAKTYGDASFTLSASASSGLPVSYSSSVPGVATVSGNTVSIIGAGSTVITATQSGDANRSAAAPVTQTLVVNQAAQTISFSPLPSKTLDDPAFALTANASSGLPVTYASSNPAVATISGNIVSLIGTGSTVITTTQPGDANFLAADPVANSLVVSASATDLLLVQEPFNYTESSTNADPDGGLNSHNGLPATNSGGTPSGTSVGLYGNYGADHSVVSGLAYSDANGSLTTSANALRRSSGTGFSATLARIYRQMSVDPFASYRSAANANVLGWNGSSARQLHFSVLLQVSAVNTGADNRLVLALGKDNTQYNVYISQANGTNQWRYGDQEGTGATLGSAVANQPVLIVGRLSFNSATQFVTEYWFNPALGQPLGTPTFSKTHNTSTSGGQFLGIQTRDGANILTYDEFRLGTSAAAVLPFSSVQSQSITFDALPARTYGEGTFTLSATASSGLPVSYSSNNPDVATVSGNTVTIIGVGSTVITATQAGNAAYSAANPVSQTLVVNQSAQSITFDAIPPKTFGDAPFTLSASASSGLPVSYASNNPDVATVSGDTVTIIGAGSAVITATQAGDANRAAAAPVSQTLVVNQSAQSITFDAIPPRTFGDASFTLSATASSGLPVSYASNNPDVAAVSGDTVTITGAGSAVITATQAGDANRAAAAPVAQTFIVNQTTQFITFHPVAPRIVGDPAFALTATASSGLPVEFASANPAVATISGSTVTIVGAGSTVITATQPGDTNRAAANPVTQTLVVAAAFGDTLLIQESFNYTLSAANPDPDGGGVANSGNGLPATNSGGTPSGTSVGLYGSYGTDHTVVTGLAYSDANGTLTTSANALRRATGTGFSATLARVYRQMAVDPFATFRSTADGNLLGWNGSTSRQLFFSVLLNVSAVNTGADNRFVLNLGTDNASWNVYFTQANGTSQWRYGDQSGTGATLGSAVANQTVLVVGRLAFHSATQFVTDFWFNPALGQPLGTPTYTKTYTTTTSGGQFRGIQTRDGAGILTYDEFRLGTTAAAVLPFNALPAAPSGLAASAVSASQIDLTWTDASTNETGFKIERSLDGITGWTQIAAASANATSHADTGLAAVTTYHYRVRSTNASGDSAPSSAASATTTQIAQSITFAPLADRAFDAPDFSLGADASSGLPVTYSSGNPSVASVSGNVVSIHGVGSTTITAYQAGNATFSAATPVERTLVIVPAPQEITFNSLPARTFGSGSFFLEGTTTAGLAVIYTSSDPSVAVVNGNVVTIVGAGTVTITATQAGNGNFGAADSVSQSLTVERSPQAITFPSIAEKSLADEPFDPGATTSSGLDVSYTSSNPAVATVSGDTIFITGVGTTTITASQNGNANFLAASDVSQTVTVGATNILLVRESFNYTLNATNPDPDGGLNNHNGLPATNVGGTPGTSSTGLFGVHGADQTVVGGLTYSDATGSLSTSGNALRRHTGTGFSASLARIYRQMSVDPYSTYRSVANANALGWNGSTPRQLFFSVLLNASAINTGTDNRFVINLGLDNSSWNVYINQANGTGKWRYGDQSGAAADLGPAVAGQTVLLVGRLSFNSATNFVTEYWFNPPLNQSLGTPTYTKTYTTTTSGGQFNGVQTRDGANILTYDEFRLGTTQASVMPMSSRVLLAQSINFNTPAAQTYGAPSFALEANATSGLPVLFTSGNPSVATVSGATVTIMGPGTTTITASQPGSATFAAAPSVSRNLTVLPAPTLESTFAALIGDAVGPAYGSSSVLPQGTWEIQATGAGAAGVADAAWFESRSITGDFQIVACLTGISGGTAARFGLMARNSERGDSVALAALAGGDGLFHVGLRSTQGANMVFTNPSALAATLPTHLLIERFGNTLVTAVSEDGAAWTNIHSVTIPNLAPTMFVGLCGSSGSLTSNAKGTFDPAGYQLVSLTLPGLVGAWYCDENTGTQSANGVAGGQAAVAASGSTFPTWLNEGKVGSGLGFNGTSQALGIPNHAALNVSDAMTFTAWIRPSSWSGGTRTVAQRGRWNSSRVWSVEKTAAGTLNFTIRALNGGTGGTVSTTNLPAPGTWTHLAATYDSTTGTASIYFNGVLQGSASFAPGTPVGTVSEELRLGADEAAGNFTGEMDGIQLYNRALTPEDLGLLGQ